MSETFDHGGRPAGAPPLGGLLGTARDEVRARLGDPAVDRLVGEERWMMYEGDGWTVRLRAERPPDGGSAVVRSWTVTFEEAHASLEDACRAVGVTPARPSPDDASPVPGLLRRPLIDVSTGLRHSLTADTRGGAVVRLTAFDEPPEWRG